MTRTLTTIRNALFAAGALCLAMSIAAPYAHAAETKPAAASVQASYEQDRKSILAMAGTFKVTFDFRETVSFLADYTPIAAKVSGGHEVVRVVEDRPGFVSLQHLLVVGAGEGKPVVIKHWRQDWTWQPKTVLVYDRPGHWSVKPVDPARAAGAWSQTVWQTDDSPRYGGVGRWAYDDGVARWTSEATWRPLARRDATRHPPYDHYIGTNRHALTPQGWVHEQDNAKIGPHEGAPATYAHEVVLNTYRRADDFAVDAADAYWDRTKPYWAEVRKDWDRAIAKGGVSVTEEAENGSVTGPKLMGLAEEVAEGRRDTASAVTEARAVIAAATGG